MSTRRKVLLGATIGAAVCLITGLMFCSTLALQSAPRPAPTSLPSAPAFAWPPPAPTVRSPVRRDVLFQAGLPGGTLAAVAARLGAALDACGYAERAWFSIPGGFALVTRLEQINDDGTPKSGAARWAAEPPRQIAGIRDYMRALFSAPGGRFRVVVFLVTDEPVGGGTPAPARAEAVGWLREGALSLPPEIAAQPLGDAHQAYAYIYEFEKQGDAEARFLAESRLTAQAHLNAAGLLMALGARP